VIKFLYESRHFVGITVGIAQIVNFLV